MNDKQKFLLLTFFFLMLFVFSMININIKQTKEEKTLLVNIDTVKLKKLPLVKLKQKPLREKVYDYLTETKGLSKNHALGLIANGDRESNWRTDVLGDNNTSGGIFQWHAVRFIKMKKNVKNWRHSWKDQVDYALTESVGPEWCKKNFKTPEEAAKWWMIKWEKPANKRRATKRNNEFIKKYNSFSRP